jgi:hypothetical protein
MQELDQALMTPVPADLPAIAEIAASATGPDPQNAEDGLLSKPGRDHPVGLRSVRVS